MKKKLSLLLVVCMTALFAACGSDAGNNSANDSANGSDSSNQGNSGTGEADVPAERTTFTVGFDAEFPPYGYMDDNGEYVGFDLDLAAEVCLRNGWELIKRPIDWDSKDMELSSGSIDCIWNGFTMNGRETAYTWSSPYVDNSQVFVVAADSGISAFEDLAGQAVGVQRDSSALSALNDEETPENIALRDSFGSLTEYADYNTAFMDLEAGALDAVAMDIGVADYQIESRGGGYVILEQRLAAEQYGVGFLLGNEELRNVVEATLNEMAADGTFAEIAEKWGLTDSICFGQ